MSDNQSTTTSAARKKAADKHCMAEECNGKKITASNWGTHKRDKKHQDDVEWRKCDGQDCQHC
jgi:hypothetical protein